MQPIKERSKPQNNVSGVFLNRNFGALYGKTIIV
jgi:hypothetical protein